MASKPVLLGPDGNPIAREPLMQEIAAPTITGVRSPITGYPADGLNPRRLASLLRAADASDPLRYFELAEQIEERDLHYAGVLGTRKRAITQLEITVEAASENADDVRRADMVRAWLTRDELTDELFNILDAIGKGVSFAEIIWDTSTGQWRPMRIEWRDQRWFRFAIEDGVTPLLRVDEGFVPLPPFKFIAAVIRAKSGLPVRSGLARLAAWSWMFKAFTLRDWAIFTQTYGQPIRVGKYAAGATEADKDTLFKAVANIAGDCAAIIPDSMSIEFIESKSGATSIDLYERRADWLDKQVSKAVLGQTSTTDAVTGGLGSGKEHRQVQEDIERADAKALSAILNRDLVRPWIDLEEGPQERYPRLRIGHAEDRDVVQVVDAVERLVPLGMRVGRDWANAMLGIPIPDPDEELLVPPAQPSPPMPALASLQAANVAKRETDAVDALATQADTLAGPAADDLIDTVRRLVDSAGSLADVRDAVLALEPQMARDKLAEVMQLALVMAQLSGRAEIADQAPAAGG